VTHGCHEAPPQAGVALRKLNQGIVVEVDSYSAAQIRNAGWDSIVRCETDHLVGFDEPEVGAVRQVLDRLTASAPET